MNPRALLLLLPLLLLVAPPAAATSGHYVPRPGDGFAYSEVVTLGSGMGNYSSYAETTLINGTVDVTAVAANGTESAAYYNHDAYSNSLPESYSWNASGRFTFSANTFLYVQGTDNQSGYTDPNVWFYMDNTLAAGASFALLNTPMTVAQTQGEYQTGGGSGGWVAAIVTQGSGSYPRDDSYGVFNAVYTWNVWFDPSTGYIIGYSYNEVDRDGAGDGFTIQDTLYETSTSYPLTPTSAPASSSPSGLSTSLMLALVLLVVVVVVVIAGVALSRSRRRAALPKHSFGGNVQYGPPPGVAAVGTPPPVHLTPTGQPAVQQIVLRETVKVNCRYCGTLIDSTATACPNCGAPRT